MLTRDSSEQLLLGQQTAQRFRFSLLQLDFVLFAVECLHFCVLLEGSGGLEQGPKSAVNERRVRTHVLKHRLIKTALGTLSAPKKQVKLLRLRTRQAFYRFLKRCVMVEHFARERGHCDRAEHLFTLCE